MTIGREQWTAALVAHSASFFRLLAANVCFNRVEFADPPQRLLRHWRFVRDVQTVELPPHVRPAGRFLNPSRFIELVPKTTISRPEAVM